LQGFLSDEEVFFLDVFDDLHLTVFEVIRVAIGHLDGSRGERLDAVNVLKFATKGEARLNLESFLSREPLLELLVNVVAADVVSQDAFLESEAVMNGRRSRVVSA